MQTDQQMNVEMTSPSLSFPLPVSENSLVNSVPIRVPPTSSGPYNQTNNVIRITLPNSSLLRFSNTCGILMTVTIPALGALQASGVSALFNQMTLRFNSSASGTIEQITSIHVLSSMLLYHVSDDYCRSVASNLEGVAPEPNLLGNVDYGNFIAARGPTAAARTYQFLWKPVSGFFNQTVFPASLFPNVVLELVLNPGQRALIYNPNSADSTAADIITACAYSIDSVYFCAEALTCTSAYTSALADHVIKSGLVIKIPSYSGTTVSLSTSQNQVIRLGTHSSLSHVLFGIVPEVLYTRAATTTANLATNLWRRDTLSYFAGSLYAAADDGTQQDFLADYSWETDGQRIPSTPITLNWRNNAIAYSNALACRGLLQNYSSGVRFSLNNNATLVNKQVHSYDFSSDSEMQTSLALDRVVNLSLVLNFSRDPVQIAQLFFFRRYHVTMKIEPGTGSVSVIYDL